MIVQVKLFAAAKDLVGREVLEVELPDKSHVVDLRAAVIEAYPSLKSIVEHAHFAIDREFANDQSAIPAESEVACIPPVSGG